MTFDVPPSIDVVDLEHTPVLFTTYNAASSQKFNDLESSAAPEGTYFTARSTILLPAAGLAPAAVLGGFATVVTGVVFSKSFHPGILYPGGKGSVK